MRLVSIAARASQLYDATLAVVYPQACQVCAASVDSRHGGVACRACWEKTRVFSDEEVICWKCGAPSQGKVAEDKREQVRCRRCDEDGFTAARACGLYEGALRACLLQLKRKPHVPKQLVRLMSDACRRQPINEATLIVPVPLHPERERERGFNQAAVLARALGQAAQLRCDEWSLTRVIHTDRHRTGMDARARRESVAGAFEVKRPRLIEGERVLLIDDVFTTGATVSACAAALKVAGAEDVFVLTVARPQTW